MLFRVDEDEALLEASAERFGREHLSPREREHEQEGYGEAARAAFAELGLAGIALPEEAGGAGMGLSAAARVWERLSHADPAAARGLDPWGPAALALAAVGRSDVLSEASGGALIVSDGARDEAHVPYVPCTQADVVLIAEPERLRLLRGATLTALPSPACGLRALRGGALDLSAAEEEILGDGAAAAVATSRGRLFAAACMLGAARDANAHAMRYAQERVAFGRPIAHHQGLAFALMDAATDLDAAGLLLEASAAGDPLAVAQAHALVTQTALWVTDRAVQALGGHGYLFDHRVEKRMRDVRVLASLYGGAALSRADAALAIRDADDALRLPS